MTINLFDKMGFFRPVKTPETSSLEMIISKDDEVVNCPNLGKKVFFAGRCFFGGAVSMFKELGCEPTNDITEAGLVVFLGGEDIDPRLYGDQPHRTTSFNPARDEAEIEIFLQAQALNIPMFGICRGMQFLHAMAGGILWQNVANHAGQDHSITDLFSGEQLMSTSLHHQMCIYNGPRVTDKVYYCVPVAKSSETRSGFYQGGRSEMTSNKEMELEAAYYPEINAFATQGHPEMGRYADYTFWCAGKLIDLFNNNYPKKPVANVEISSGPWIPEERDEQIRVEAARQIG